MNPESPLGYSVARGLPARHQIRWRLEKSDELFRLVYGKALVSTSREKGGVPVYGANGQCGWHSTPIFKGPGIIIGRKGQGHLGVRYCPGDYWVIDTAYSLELKKELCLKYCYYLVCYVGLNHLKDGTSNPTLSRDSFGRQLFPVPPLVDQEAIASILGALDDKIELNRKSNETLEGIAKALFKSWFVNFDPVRAKAEGRPTGLPDEISELFPDSFEESELGEIPSGWRLGPLLQILQVDPKRSLTKGSVSPYLEMKGVPTSGHSAEGVYDREFTSGTKFQNGDTLLARITPCLENGKTTLVDFLEEGQIGWGSTEFIVLCGIRPEHNSFAYYLSRSNEFREHAIRNMVGSSGRQRVPSDALADFCLAQAPMSILNAFSSLADSLLECISHASKENLTLSELRDALLPRLISGELRVPDAEKILGEVGI